MSHHLFSEYLIKKLSTNFSSNILEVFPTTIVHERSSLIFQLLKNVDIFVTEGKVYYFYKYQSIWAWA